VVDLYSANEVGYLALQCPEHGRYHEQAESLLLEVLDEAGRPCGPGSTGRVVVTALWNYAMPLIRYEIGDYAEVAGPCPCGRGLPALGRILGRTRNMIALPTGERIWPSLGVASMRSLAPILQCQIVQHALDRLEARLVVERPLTPAEEGRIRANLLKKLPCPMGIELSYPERIERGPTWKFEEVRSLL
jgi:phenylacetate-CoA ligase